MVFQGPCYNKTWSLSINGKVYGQSGMIARNASISSGPDQQASSPDHRPLSSAAPLSFTVEACCTQTRARAGSIQTPHGVIRTPVFMPVGTQASVKSLTPRELREIGAQIILSNTYHLYLRPGPEVIARFGGLHGFSRWTGPILTDSGGFQVFSLGHLRRLNDDGVTFKSHLDGSEHILTPEKVITVEEQFGADIILPLDECVPYPYTYEGARLAMERTHRWARRALAAKTRSDQALFGIVQGWVDPDLRRESARFIGNMPFAGFAIGGLSVGEPKAMMWEMLDITVPELPEDKPRHLLGVGSPEDLFEGVARGIDMFDCVLPTRVARNGGLFTLDGRVNIASARFREEHGPVDPSCDCPTCAEFSAGYLHHLARSGELLYYRLASLHNLRFMFRLIDRIRQSIFDGTFSELRSSFLTRYVPASEAVRAEQRQRWLAARKRGSHHHPG
jgi:queuine tRNA-ribosyltransferase